MKNQMEFPVLLIYRQTFGSLDHGILLAKLSNYGLRVSIYNQMVDYLSNRSLCICERQGDIAKTTNGFYG